MIYNVRVSIIELVEADSEQAAIDKLAKKAENAGLTPMEDECEVVCPSCGAVAEEHKYHDAFESEDLDPKSLASVLR